MIGEDAFSALSGLAAFANTDLVLCSRRGKLVYKTAGVPDKARETLASYRELFLSLFPPGGEECRKVRELLTDPRGLAVLFWRAGDWKAWGESAVLTWVVDGFYERTVLSRFDVGERVWGLSEKASRIHLADPHGRYVIDVERADLHDLRGVYAVTRRTVYALLVGASRANAFLEALQTASFPRDLRVYRFGGDGLY